MVKWLVNGKKWEMTIEPPTNPPDVLACSDQLPHTDGQITGKRCFAYLDNKKSYAYNDFHKVDFFKNEPRYDLFNIESHTPYGYNPVYKHSDPNMEGIVFGQDILNNGKDTSKFVRVCKSDPNKPISRIGMKEFEYMIVDYDHATKQVIYYPYNKYEYSGTSGFYLNEAAGLPGCDSVLDSFKTDKGYYKSLVDAGIKWLPLPSGENMKIYDNVGGTHPVFTASDPWAKWKTVNDGLIQFAKKSGDQMYRMLYGNPEDDPNSPGAELLFNYKCAKGQIDNREVDALILHDQNNYFSRKPLTAKTFCPDAAINAADPDKYMIDYCRLGDNLWGSNCRSFYENKQDVMDTEWQKYCKKNENKGKDVCGCMYPIFKSNDPVIPNLAQCYADNCSNSKAYKPKSMMVKCPDIMSCKQMINISDSNANLSRNDMSLYCQKLGVDIDPPKPASPASPVNPASPASPASPAVINGGNASISNSGSNSNTPMVINTDIQTHSDNVKPQVDANSSNTSNIKKIYALIVLLIVILFIVWILNKIFAPKEIKYTPVK